MNENSAKARATLDEVLTESIVRRKFTSIFIFISYVNNYGSSNALYVKVREFASNWRTGIQQINDNVLAYFANFRNGMEILKQVLPLFFTCCLYEDDA